MQLFHTSLLTPTIGDPEEFGIMQRLPGESTDFGQKIRDNKAGHPWWRDCALSFIPALRGLRELFHERNARVQLVIFAFTLTLTAWLEIEPWGWALIVAMGGLVLGLEAINTALERLADFVCKDLHPEIGRIKDLAAGAVLAASMAALVVGVILLGPGLWSKVLGG